MLLIDLVCRPKSEQARAGALETMCKPTATTIRRRVFGGASRPSASVRHRSRTHRIPSHAANRRRLHTSQDRARDDLRATSRSCGLHAGVLFELRTMMCSSCACGAAAKSAVVAIARDVSMSTSCRVCSIRQVLYVAVLACSVEPWGHLRLSGMGKVIFFHNVATPDSIVIA